MGTESLRDLVRLGAVIAVDYSLGSTLKTCEEKARLQYVLGLQPKVPSPAPAFGSALHEGIAELYRTGDLTKAEAAVYEKLKSDGAELPVAMEDGRRSVERAINLLRCYDGLYRPTENYEVIVQGGRPLIEIGYAIHLFDWDKRPVMLVGRIDMVMRSKTTGEACVKDVKTTTMNVPAMRKQVKPNHQFTLYDHAVETILGIKCRNNCMDIIYVSDRQPNPKKGGWMSMGIDEEKDFGREFTTRSETDIEEALRDVSQAAEDFIRLKQSGRPRWHRNAPTACQMYGGCQFRDVCSSNLNPNIIEAQFKVEPWEPWTLKEGAL